MITGKSKCLLALALSLTIAACTSGAEVPVMMMQSPSNGIESNELVVDGNRGTIALSNIGAIRKTLSEYSSVAGHGSLGHRIQHIRTANLDSAESVPGLTGLGGVLGHAFLDLTEQGLQGNNFNGQARVVVSMSGQILDYEYDSSDGSGLIEAVTYISRSVVTPGLGVPPARVTAYKYKVEVDPGGFTVVPHSNNRDDPFPGTLAFSPEMLDRVESLGFMYKLWANGTAIGVTDVWRDDNFQWGSPANFTLLDPSDPEYARLYQTDADSCIDMMFVDQPPATYADLQGPPFYCLGRCADPLLINTR
ncbi:MAG: hypothetical protein OEN23_12275 [Paracoccaceae bacterium]|nr:hypothetical protein [Paracoccaceae bacterium]